MDKKRKDTIESAKKAGLCEHCCGTAIEWESLGSSVWRNCSNRDYFPNGKMPVRLPCRDCRGTGRNLYLEARSKDFHRERASELSFAKLIREWSNLYYVEHFSTWGFRLTPDEKLWQEAIFERLRYEFKLGCTGNLSVSQDHVEWILYKWMRRIYNLPHSWKDGYYKGDKTAPVLECEYCGKQESVIWGKQYWEKCPKR
jgi:hypothetical protein